MAIRSGFFNSVNGDRRYLANNFAEYFSTFIGNGVFPDPAIGLQVQTKLNMTITVKPGKGWINGYYLINDGDFDLTISNADGVLNRIDRVVMRWDINTRNIVVQLKKGSFASSPVAPALQRDQEIFELALADIYVAKGITSISQSAITDKRLEKSLCGIVSGVVDQIDTTNLFAQYNVSFNEWFDTVKDYLNDTAVGNVANKLAEHTMDGTAHGIGDKKTLLTTKKNTLVEAINELADYVRTPGYGIATGTNAYAVTLNPAPTNYKDGMGLIIKIVNSSTATASINVNGLGAKPILKANGTAMTEFKAGVVYSLRYNGTNFYLQGEGGNEKEIFRNVGKILATTMYKQQLKYMNDDYYFTSETFNKPDYGFEYYFRKYTRTNATLIKTTVFNNNTHPNGDFPDNTNYKVNYSEFGIISKNKAFDENGTLLISFNYEPTCFGANASEFVYLNSKSMELRNSLGGTLLRTIATETRSNITFRECLVRKEMSDFYLNIIKFSYTEPSVRLQLKNFTGPDSDGGEYIRAENIVNSSMIIT